MQAIRAGDLYFLQSPFSSGMVKDAIGTSQTEKRLSYLLGTVSSRPAVVIRPPTWWDRYNTVTVIPAITKGKPAIVFKLDDRYGFETEAEYPFVPHNPHTIPVARLGRYIGSLSGDELETLLYAFKWIHDPLMQADITIEVPSIYKDVWAKKHIPQSWKDNRDARADVQISITPDMTLQSKTNPELNGFNIGSALGIFTDPIPAAADAEFVPIESVLPDSTKTKEETDMSESNKKNTVPVEKAFPDSIFSNNDLWKVAARFTIDDKFYDGECTIRNPIVMNGAELDKAFGDVPRHVREDVLDVYRKMTPFDAFLLGPRLPLQTLADLLGLPRNEAHMLKMVCNIMRDLEESEYLKRLYTQAPAEVTSEDTSSSNVSSNDSKVDMAAASAHLAKIKPFLSAKNVMNIPQKYVSDFLATPMFMVQRAWKGPQFKTSYQKAMAHYVKKGA